MATNAPRSPNGYASPAFGSTTITCNRHRTLFNPGIYIGPIDKGVHEAPDYSRGPRVRQPGFSVDAY